MSKTTIKVPFNAQGALMHYANPRAAMQGYYAAAEWREATEFYAKLTLEGIESGRSAKYLTWIDEEGRRWPMFVAELVQLLQGSIVAHGIAKGLWIPCKRGQNYGLRYAGPDLKRGSSG